MGISPEKVVQFLNTRAPGATCGFCRRNSLRLIQKGKEMYKYGAYEWSNLSSGMPVYAVGCTNCGHVHFFSKKFIESQITGVNSDHTIPE